MERTYKHFVPHNLGRRIEDAALVAVSDGEMVSLDPVTLELEGRVDKSMEEFNSSELKAWARSVRGTFNLETVQLRNENLVMSVVGVEGIVDMYQPGVGSRLGWIEEETGTAPHLYEIFRDLSRDWLVGPRLDSGEEILNAIGFSVAEE